MKKTTIITLAIFVVVTILGLATNFIHWDETPLEQSIAALPLGIGLMLEVPFFTLMGMWIDNTTGYVPYQTFWTVIPFVAGAFYSGLFYFIVRVTGVISKQRSQNVDRMSAVK